MSDSVYAYYASIYKRRSDTGRVILGAPAVGKTTFVKNQTCKQWIDQDELFADLGLAWSTTDYNDSTAYLQADELSSQTRARGFCIIGSLFWSYVPDAIVMPPLHTHLDYLSQRLDLCADQVLQVRNILYECAQSHAIPLYDTCAEAAEAVL